MLTKLRGSHLLRAGWAPGSQMDGRRWGQRIWGRQWERLLGGDLGPPPPDGEHEICFQSSRTGEGCRPHSTLTHVQGTLYRNQVCGLDTTCLYKSRFAKKFKMFGTFFPSVPSRVLQGQHGPSLACWPLVDGVRSGTTDSRALWVPGQPAACWGAGSLVAALHVQFWTGYMMGKYLLWFHRLLLFQSVYCVLWCSEVLAFEIVHVAYFYFCFLCLCFHSRKSLPNAMSWRFPAVFPSRSFIPLCVTFSSLIHFDLIFSYGVYF